MRRCFVISPIGPEGSPVRKHADDVFDFIIKPAMEQCGIHPYRADHLQEPGKLTEQMFREILTDDLVIAVLTGYNANVFYELAVAHAADRPVIILIEKGESLPFDIHDLRCVYYDLSIRSIYNKLYETQIVDHVLALEANDWKVPSLFGRPIIEVAKTDDPKMLSFFKDGSEFGNPDRWFHLLEEANDVFEIMGIHLMPWRGTKGFSELLVKKAEQGCAVRILLMHPKNRALTHMINESLTDVDLKVVTREISEMAGYFTQIARKSPKIALRLVQRGTLHCQTTRTDRYGVYLPYLYSRRRRYCPLWQCGLSSPLYKVVVEEFDGLWQVNEPGP